MKKGMCLLMAIVLMIISVPSFAASFDDDGVLRLVNREEKITKNYDPDDLVKPDVPVNKKNQEEQIYMRREAAEALEKYADMVYRLAYAQTRSRQDADDVFQETFIRLVKSDVISAFTRETGRIAYVLSSSPRDMSALSAAMPDAEFNWCQKKRRLVCSFPAGIEIADVNRRLLPVLLVQTDVISVVPGQSLEEAFLNFPYA